MVFEFYSGSYGTVGEDGIVRFRVDTDVGTIEKLYAYQGIKNPSYLGFNPTKTILYAVQEEVPVGAVHALKVTDSDLQPLKRLSSEGADPCHVIQSDSGKVLFVSNYTSGALAVYRMGDDETPKERTDLIVHEGKGTNPVRQEAPHVHFTKEHNGQVFVVDLGLDQVFLYDIDDEQGKLTNTGKRLQFPAGSGPRHIAFHHTRPEIVYVVCELACKVAVFVKSGEDYELRQMISTLPEDFAGENICAAIKMQGSLLFASNRGHDSIAVYRVKEDGLLELTQIVPSGGKTPRDFDLIGDYMVVANQDSNSITVLQVDWEAATLRKTNMEIATVKPCCSCKYRGE